MLVSLCILAYACYYTIYLDLEYMTVKCRPIHLPRFTIVLITAMYILPDSNVSSALRHLNNIISSQQSMYPEAVHIVVGEFNHADLKTAYIPSPLS